MKTYIIGLSLSILTATTSLLLPTPVISQRAIAENKVAQVQVQKSTERKRIAVLDFDFASTSNTDRTYARVI